MKEIETGVLIIGAGPGGYYAGIRLGQLGAAPVVVERERAGGICLNHGCIPSKALIHASKVYERAQESSSMGIVADGIRLDWPRMREWKDSVVGRLTDGVARLLKANGAKLLMGEARFVSDREVVVVSSGGAGEPGEEIRIKAEKIVIASGARAVELPLLPFRHPRVISSREALTLEEIPRRMVVVGGGYIGLELGMVFQRLGSQVTVVEMADRVLSGTPADLVRPVQRSLKHRGIRLLVGARVKGMLDDGGGEGAQSVRLEVETQDGSEELEAEQVLVSAGTRPNTDGLGLEHTAIDTDDKGFVKTGADLSSSVPGVYAIGDVRGGMMLAHKAYMEAELVSDLVMGRARSTEDVTAIPWAVFTEPEVVGVGLSEEEAKERGYQVRTGRFPLGASGRSLAMNEGEGFVKVVVDDDTDRLLGLFGVGADLSELSGEMALALEMEATAADLGATIHAHPTLSEAIQDACHGAHGRAIHTTNRKSR